MHPQLYQHLVTHLGSTPFSDPADTQRLNHLLSAINRDYEELTNDHQQAMMVMEHLSESVCKRNNELEVELAVKQRVEAELLHDKEEQQMLIRQLEEAHNQLLQSEKMASIGQLAAGVAHEINNPIGFIHANLSTLQSYVHDLLNLLAQWQNVAYTLSQASPTLPIPALIQQLDAIQHAEKDIDLAFIRDDITTMIQETQEGTQRVKRIVQDLKDFSHVDHGEWGWEDIHKGIDSTLNIVNNELKYKATIVKHYGNLPKVHCILSQLNQVFMNLLVNAAHAIAHHGTITITTGSDLDWVWIEFKDTGAGIAPEHLKCIFDPFFTTKPIGQGTGLGLSLSYGIMQKHRGNISAESTVGEGTTFRLMLPTNTVTET